MIVFIKVYGAKEYECIGEITGENNKWWPQVITVMIFTLKIQIKQVNECVST